MKVIEIILLQMWINKYKVLLDITVKTMFNNNTECNRDYQQLHVWNCVYKNNIHKFSGSKNDNDL